MSTESPVTVLTRDIDAIQIPSGLTKKLQKGTPVIITQALGGTYTVVVEQSAHIALSQLEVDLRIRQLSGSHRVRCPWHQLHQANGATRALGPGIER